MKQAVRIFLWLVVFGVAFAFLESTVVVYLRKIFYPEGFHFPLIAMYPSLAEVETFREGATIIILISISFIAGKNNLQKFAYFIFCFAVWDIFYYVFLKILIDWPSSLLTWDLLFLIPIPWIAPVIAPVIVAFTMIFFSITTIIMVEKGFALRIHLLDALVLFFGCFVIFISFILDFIIQVIIHHQNDTGIVNYMPDKFHWSIFIFGELILICGIILFLKNSLKKKT